MKIDLFQIGNFHVRGYGFMIGLGFLLALVLGCKRAKKLELKDESVIDIAILAIIGGFLGAKILYVIVSFKDFLKDPLAVLGSEGFVVYGGIIAGVLAAWIYCKVKKLVFLEYFDLIMPEVALAQGFGRIGWLLGGRWFRRGKKSDLLLRTGNNRRMGYYISRRQHGADRHKAYSDTASFSSRGFFDCRNPDMDCTPFFISAEKADNRRYRQYLFTAVRYRKISD